uniref:Uncharacterized protein n=1 Tax=Electrophorus electricus TaxID=8005 RepID=A0A4W4FRF8_ELEEL
SIRLPCIKFIHVNLFQVLERKAELLHSLGMLKEDVHCARTWSQPGCGLVLLERLECSKNNCIAIILLQREGEREKGPQTFACLGQDSQDLVLRQFGRLLSAKLEWLITDFRNQCLSFNFAQWDRQVWSSSA